MFETIEATTGPVPRIFLHDTEGGDEPPLVRTGAGPTERAEAPWRYQILGEIARGGMGVVLKGRDLGRDLALKVLLEEHGDKPEMVRRFVEEAQIGGQLQHPGVVPVYELGTSPDRRPFFAMKLVKGRTLADLLESRSGPGDELPRFLGIFEQVCQTVAYAHARGVIHRDLKPSNIMVGRFGEVQVMHWGLAKLLESGGVADDERTARRQPESIIQTSRSGSDADASRAGSVLGTPAYMAPEQARGQLGWLDERADVFGLGAILREILTGLPPYAARSSGEALRMAAQTELEDGLARLDACGADSETLALARRCLAVDPRHRPRDAGEVALAMRTYLDGVQDRARRAELERAEAQARAIEERKRRRLTVALAATVMAAWLAGGAAWLADRRARDGRLNETRRVVEDALAQTGALLEEARRAPEGSLEPWTRAASAAERAKGLLAGREAPADLADRVEANLADVVREDKAARDRARQAEVDRVLVADLDAARISFVARSVSGWNNGEMIRAYFEAFRRAGTDLDSPTAAAGIAARSPRVRIAAALDDWWMRERDSAGRRRLAAIARAADHDPLRNRLRDAVEANDRPALVALADGTDPAALPPSTVLRLAGALDACGESARAIGRLRRAYMAHPDDLWIHIDLASLLRNRRPPRPEEAARHGTAALALAPGNLSLRNDMATGLIGATRLDEAEPILREILRLRPDFAYAHTNLSHLFVLRGEFARAMDEARKAIRLDPADTNARNNLGICLVQAGRTDEAVEQYREALRLDPGNNLPRVNLAHVLLQTGRIDEAAAAWAEAVELEPDRVDRGDFLARHGRWCTALDDLTRAYRANPDNHYLWLQLAALYLQAGDDAGYRRHCLAGLDRFGGTDEPMIAERIAKACLLARMGLADGGRASHLAEVAVVRGTRNRYFAWFEFTRALADYRNGRLGQANATLNRIRATQEDAALLIHSDLILAMAHHRLGDGAEALKHLAAASRAHDAFMAGSRADLGVSWHDWVIVGLLRREAEATIFYDPIFPAEPFARGTISR